MPNIWTLAGGRFVAGTAGCVSCPPQSLRCIWADSQDAFGFLYTTILFSQHLYTLLIAVATFLLLVSHPIPYSTSIDIQKHPLSPITSWVERHSMWAMPAIWIVSFAHAGAWWAHAGWSTSGPLCYYAPKIVSNDLDARDLVQFIPRAFVFITIIVLYSMLYKFLRRPDTIQLSSQFVSGETGTNNGERRKRGVLSGLKWKGKSNTCSQNGRGAIEHSASKIDPNAPWEQLEFVKVGGRDLLSPLDNGLSLPSTQSLGGLAVPSTPQHRGSITSIYFAPQPSGTRTPEPLSSANQTKRPSLVSTWSSSSESRIPLTTLSSQRPSQSDTIITVPDSKSAYAQKQNLSPVISQNATKTDPRIDRDIEFDLGPDVVDSLKYTGENGVDEDDSPGETLGQFFKGDIAPAEDSRAERGGMSNNNGLPQMSATAYFNRQASLLMLYFPLAVSLQSVPRIEQC